MLDSLLLVIRSRRLDLGNADAQNQANATVGRRTVAPLFLRRSGRSEGGGRSLTRNYDRCTGELASGGAGALSKGRSVFSAAAAGGGIVEDIELGSRSAGRWG